MRSGARTTILLRGATLLATVLPLTLIVPAPAAESYSSRSEPTWAPGHEEAGERRAHRRNLRPPAWRPERAPVHAGRSRDDRPRIVRDHHAPCAVRWDHRVGYFRTPERREPRRRLWLPGGGEAIRAVVGTRSALPA
jgi:hypothetical protein